MATITVSGDNTRITDADEVRDFLKPHGISHEKWEVDGRLSVREDGGADATNEEILDAYKPEIDRLKQQGGYVTADVINVTADTPGLDEMLAKFDKEHTHSEDEVRFTIEGRGVFWIHPADDPVFAIEVEKGDLINVPAGTKHWFHLCESRTIRCIRLFEDPSGWTPEYIDSAVHSNHAPVCWGESYLPKTDEIDSPVKL